MNNCTTVSKDFLRCGACIYWSGEKEVYGNIIQYDVYSVGRCNNVESPAHGKTMVADNYCLSKKDY